MHGVMITRENTVEENEFTCRAFINANFSS